MIEYYCRQCGTRINKNVTHRCHTENSALTLPKIGYSELINDARFAQYIRHADQWALIFASILAFCAIAGFTLYGIFSDEMNNPQALFIGLGIGSMFVLIAFVRTFGRYRSKTWDGIVTDKTVSNNQTNAGIRSEYIVSVMQDNGKEHRLASYDDDTIYNYYHVGESVRHHAGLNSYEKYDKTKDSFLFCSECASLCERGDNYCFRCGCPLLK